MSTGLDLSKFKIVFIEWEDSHADNEWKEYDDCLKDCKMSIVKSIGYLLVENEKYITISHSIAPKEELICDPITIPKRAIVKKRILRIDL